MKAIPKPALLLIAGAAIGTASTPALAYVGPGAGLTLLGALWGLVVAVVVSLGFVLLWPFRKLLRRNKQVCQSARREAAEDDATHSMLAESSVDRSDRRS